MSADFFDNVLWTGQALVCLDGLDEIPTAGARAKVIEQIECLEETYPRSRYLVTARANAYSPTLDPDTWVHYTLLPWCTYTAPELASIGMNEKRAQKAGISYTVWTEAFSDNDRALAEAEPGGKIKMLLDKKERPIGVQILGLHAGEVLNQWIAAMNGKVKLSTLAAAVYPYPTISEINKRVSGNVLAKKLFSDKVKKGLKLLFNLKGRASCDDV